MDPQACLTRLNDALVDLDYEEAASAAGDLADWMDRGGGMPNVEPLVFGEILRAVQGGLEARVRLYDLTGEE